MNTEFEIKFLDIDHDALRKQLQEMGAKLVAPMRLMRRAIIETPELKAKGAFIRVRDEGDKVTLTYKQFTDLSIDGAKEYEVTVSDFQSTVDLLAQAGLASRSLQESRRETWVFDGAEIVLDEWPWLKPYIEIEGDSEEHVQDVAKKLGLDWKKAAFGDVMVAYRAQYPGLSENETVGNLPKVRFGDPLPAFFKYE